MEALEAFPSLLERHTKILTEREKCTALMTQLDALAQEFEENPQDRIMGGFERLRASALEKVNRVKAGIGLAKGEDVHDVLNDILVAVQLAELASGELDQFWSKVDTMIGSYDPDIQVVSISFNEIKESVQKWRRQIGAWKQQQPDVETLGARSDIAFQSLKETIDIFSSSYFPQPAEGVWSLVSEVCSAFDAESSRLGRFPSSLSQSLIQNVSGFTFGFYSQCRARTESQSKELLSYLDFLTSFNNQSNTYLAPSKSPGSFLDIQMQKPLSHSSSSSSSSTTSLLQSSSSSASSSSVVEPLPLNKLSSTSETFACAVCMNDQPSEELIGCSLDHKICRGCTNHWVDKGIDAHHILPDGDLKCFGLDCGGKFSSQQLAQLLDSKVWKRLQNLVSDRKTVDIQIAVRREFEEREKRKKMASAEEKAFLFHHKYISENIMTLKCPRCSKAFLDFDGCFVVSCSGDASKPCRCKFCAWCLADCGDNNQAAHTHVATCKRNRSRNKDPFFGDRKLLEKEMRILRSYRLSSYWTARVLREKEPVRNRLKASLVALYDQLDIRKLHQDLQPRNSKRPLNSASNPERISAKRRPNSSNNVK